MATGRQRRPLERPVPDDAGTQQGRHLVVAVRGGQRVGVVLVDDGELGVAAVGIPSGEGGGEAQVLVAADAEATDAARVAQPGDADALADLEPPGPGTERVDRADD